MQVSDPTKALGWDVTALMSTACSPPQATKTNATNGSTSSSADTVLFMSSSLGLFFGRTLGTIENQAVWAALLIPFNRKIISSGSTGLLRQA